MALMSETGMVERVARTIALDWYENMESIDNPNRKSQEEYIAETWFMFEPLARRIVKRMREPTESMYRGSDAKRELWMAMIDEALTPPTRTSQAKR